MSDQKAIKILYIEDDLANLSLLERYFRSRDGYEFYSASNGAEGLSLAASLPIDLVLVDINLPIMDGFAVLSRLRSNPAYAEAPVIALTANAMPAAKQKGLEAGFNHYITKPFVLLELEEAIKNAITQQRQ